jgi:hypothetical protein
VSEDRPDPLAPPEGYGVTPANRSDGGEVDHLFGCSFGGCWLPSSICLYLGDESEHIGHLCLCATHHYQHRQRIGGIVCKLCGKPMKIIKSEVKDNPYADFQRGLDLDAPPPSLQRLLDWINEPPR